MWCKWQMAGPGSLFATEDHRSWSAVVLVMVQLSDCNLRALSTTYSQSLHMENVLPEWIHARRPSQRAARKAQSSALGAVCHWPGTPPQARGAWGCCGWRTDLESASMELGIKARLDLNFRTSSALWPKHAAKGIVRLASKIPSP